MSGRVLSSFATHLPILPSSFLLGNDFSPSRVSCLRVIEAEWSVWWRCSEVRWLVLVPLVKSFEGGRFVFRVNWLDIV